MKGSLQKQTPCRQVCIGFMNASALGFAWKVTAVKPPIKADLEANVVLCRVL